MCSSVTGQYQIIFHVTVGKSSNVFMRQTLVQSADFQEGRSNLMRLFMSAATDNTMVEGKARERERKENIDPILP